jgi:hypothetical protein
MKKTILRFIADTIFNYIIVVSVFFLYNFILGETSQNDWLYALIITVALRIYEIIKIIWEKQKKKTSK